MVSKVHRGPIQVAASFGGTKIAVALLDMAAGCFVARSGRVEWRPHPLWNALRPLESLITLVVDEVGKLMEKHGVSISDINGIGIAWPGPGIYERGLLQATFIPGVGRDKNVHQLMMAEFLERFGPYADHIVIASGLDAHARALGEVYLPDGAFSQEQSRCAPNGIVVNVATGVAGAIVISGRTLRSWKGLGSTYGQWGRFAFRNQSSGEWIWRPTADGSIPIRRTGEVRLTELCGGPALWARFSEQTGHPHRAGERDVAQEQNCLRRITEAAYAQNAEAAAFVRAAGGELAGSIECVLDAFQLPVASTKVVLTGGVGEFFGAPPKDAPGADIFLASMRDTGLKCQVVRSRAGLDAEFAGAALFCEAAAHFEG